MKKLIINEISCISGGVNKMGAFNLVFAGINIIAIPIVITANYLTSKKQKEEEKQKKHNTSIKELCSMKCYAEEKIKSQPKLTTRETTHDSLDWFED